LDLSRNRIRYVDNSVLRKQGQLETLILSENLLRSLEPGIFGDCTNLRYLSISANSISEISRYAFNGLEHLEQLDLSNNNIVELNPLAFEPFSINTNQHNHQVPKLKHLNLAHNKIHLFNFELYFPLNTNSVTSDPAYQLVSLNVSSNLLDSLDAPSVRWLKHTTAVTDLSGNPWKCECSALGEGWRELRHRLTLECASPADRKGSTWDVLEGTLCLGNVLDITNPTVTANIVTADHKPSGSPSLMTTILIVVGILSSCVLIAGGIVLVVLVKKLRDSANAPQNNNIRAPGTSYLKVPTESLKHMNPKSDHATENIYETVA
jgi:hypothetical protein